jgi:predicted transcriptional regulator
MIYIKGYVGRVVTAVENKAASDLKIEQDEFASILMNIGLKRNVAKVLTYLAGVKEATSKEIETGSDLRQPEVSIAMREIRKLDWISERDEKNLGKGRPYRIYKLNKSLPEIIDYLEQEKARESAITMMQIEKLRALRT